MENTVDIFKCNCTLELSGENLGTCSSDHSQTSLAKEVGAINQYASLKCSSSHFTVQQRLKTTRLDSILNFKELTFTWWSNCNRYMCLQIRELGVHLELFLLGNSLQLADWSLIEEYSMLKYDALASKWNEIAVFSEVAITTW